MKILEEQEAKTVTMTVDEASITVQLTGEELAHIVAALGRIAGLSPFFYLFDELDDACVRLGVKDSEQEQYRTLRFSEPPK